MSVPWVFNVVIDGDVAHIVDACNEAETWKKAFNTTTTVQVAGSLQP